MIITKEYIEGKFAEFNRMCFGNELSLPPIRMSNARGYLGKVRYCRSVRLSGCGRYSDFELIISSKVANLANEREVEDVILHEMIHYYILSNQFEDSSAHGRMFREMMQTINQRYGRNITISHRRSEGEIESDSDRRRHYFCIVRLRDGRTGLVMPAHTRIFQIWSELPQLAAVERCDWYVSCDPYFNRFRRSLSIKIYAVDMDELTIHLHSARRFKRQGKYIVAE